MVSVIAIFLNALRKPSWDLNPDFHRYGVVYCPIVRMTRIDVIITPTFYSRLSCTSADCVALESPAMVKPIIALRKSDSFSTRADTPTAKARWVLIYIHFQIYSKAYKTNELL